MHTRSAGTVSAPAVSTRRLAFTVFGTTAGLSPDAIRDALGARSRAARTAGYRDAATAFETARDYLTRAVQDRPDPAHGAGVAAQCAQGQMLAAAVDHVRRAYELLPGSCAVPLQAPVAPPDPALTDDPEELIEDLRALCDWSGATYRAIVALGSRRRLRVGEEQLLATLRDGGFPSPTVIEVIARGCGLSEQQCCAWIAARHRAARVFLPGRCAAAPTAPDPAVRTQAALDPRGAQSATQLAALLAELKERCGTGYVEMAYAARQAKCAVSQERLWAVGARFAFPTPRVLEAFLVGCGIDPDQREPWRQARKRLVGGHGRLKHTVQAELTAARERADAPPDPRGAQTWAEFSTVLHALVRWSGLNCAAIVREAITAGVPVTVDALRHVLVHQALPSTSTLDAFTVGCGLSSAEQYQWRIARARLAAATPEAQRLPPCAIHPSGVRLR
jgi:hypothetical protein